MAQQLKKKTLAILTSVKASAVCVCLFLGLFICVVTLADKMYTRNVILLCLKAREEK